MPIFKGKTEDEAIFNGLQALKIDKDHADIKVLTEARKGVLGVFAREAEVEIIPLTDEEVERRRRKALLEKLGFIALFAGAFLFSLIGALFDSRSDQEVATPSTELVATSSEKNETSETSSEKQSSSSKSSAVNNETKTETSDNEPEEPIVIDASELYELGSKEPYEVGQRYQFTGELFHQETWTTNAQGKYVVYVKAEPASPTAGLMVFTTEKEAEKWTDGTLVEFVVETKYYDKLQFEHFEVISHRIISGEKTQETEISSSTKSNKLEEYYQRLDGAVDGELIVGMKRGYTEFSSQVYLSDALLSYSKEEVKNVLRQINDSLVRISEDYGIESPIFKYYIGGYELAENRYVMNPRELNYSKELN